MIRQFIICLLIFLCFDAKSQKAHRVPELPPLPGVKPKATVVDPNDTQPPVIGAFDVRTSEMGDFPISVPFNFIVVHTNFQLNFATLSNHYYTAWQTDDLNSPWSEATLIQNATPARITGTNTVRVPVKTTGSGFYQIRAKSGSGIVWPETQDMKHMLPLLLAAGLARAAEIPEVKAPEPGKSYLANLTLSPFGALRSINISDGEQWGAGLDLGIPLNNSVSVHAQALGYSDNDWRGSAIDELGVMVRADLARYSSERLKLYALGGGDRSFDADDWSIGFGIGLNLSLTKNISAGLDTRIRAWFSRDEDLITRALVSISF